MTQVELPMGGKIQDKFERFDMNNPGIYMMFKRYALEAYQSGCKRIGAKAIMERIRWDRMITTRGDTFKINNNFASRYVRKLISESPYFNDLFEVRGLKA